MTYELAIKVHVDELERLTDLAANVARNDSDKQLIAEVRHEIKSLRELAAEEEVSLALRITDETASETWNRKGGQDEHAEGRYDGPT